MIRTDRALLQVLRMSLAALAVALPLVAGRAAHAQGVQRRDNEKAQDGEQRAMAGQVAQRHLGGRMGDDSVPEFEYPGSDEVASLSRSFNRMRRSLDSAMKMLDK